MLSHLGVRIFEYDHLGCFPHFRWRHRNSLANKHTIPRHSYTKSPSQTPSSSPSPPSLRSPAPTETPRRGADAVPSFPHAHTATPHTTAHLLSPPPPVAPPAAGSSNTRPSRCPSHSRSSPAGGSPECSGCSRPKSPPPPALSLSSLLRVSRIWLPNRTDRSRFSLNTAAVPTVSNTTSLQPFVSLPRSTPTYFALISSLNSGVTSESTTVKRPSGYSRESSSSRNDRCLSPRTTHTV